MTDTPMRVRGEPQTVTASIEATSQVPADFSNLQSEEEKLFAFINEQIEKMKTYSTIGSGEDPTFFEINQALMNYEQTYLSLLSLHNTTRWRMKQVQNTYDDWFAEKYIELREELNPRTLSAQKWLSQKEIEMYVRRRYPVEFQQRSWELNQVEQELNFLRRLLDSWQSQQFVLTQLSKNLIAESAASHLESTFAKGSD